MYTKEKLIVQGFKENSFNVMEQTDVMKELKVYQIDAFTDKVFSGNSAGVCPLKEWIEDDVMQKIAMENNLSETAFFIKSGGKYYIRWFTPECEVDLCGHATLAAAYLLFNKDEEDAEDIDFMSVSGPLNVFRKNRILYLDFPSRAPEKVEVPAKLIEALKVKPLEVLKSRDYMVVLENEEDIYNLKPDFELLRGLDCLGVIVTAKSEKYDFVSRFFAPNVNVDEDPVTGSSHSTLIPYWAKVLGKNKMTAYQASKRGGILFCEDKGERVYIGGNCALYMEGSVYL